jgi:outer membrane protein assembly factor BamB
LIDGDRLVCTPGGSDATIVALHTRNGDLAWKTGLPEGDEAAYSSAIVVDAAGVRHYVQLLQKGLVGVDAKTGELLWRYPRAVSRYNANIPTPLAHGARIYTASAGTGGGLVELNKKNGGVGVEEVYFDVKLPSAIGGVVKVGDYLYGTTGSAMICVDFATGQLKWEERALGAASLCYADERLYLHGENGDVALVEPSPAGYREKGRFAPPGQPVRLNDMEKAWAHPVIANGRLYIRDHSVLWCYQVGESRK